MTSNLHPLPPPALSYPQHSQTDDYRHHKRPSYHKEQPNTSNNLHEHVRNTLKRLKLLKQTHTQTHPSNTQAEYKADIVEGANTTGNTPMTQGHNTNRNTRHRSTHQIPANPAKSTAVSKTRSQDKQGYRWGGQKRHHIGDTTPDTRHATHTHTTLPHKTYYTKP
ncbi:Hypothetical predicted protein [Pelobates cultripes]|uniref:Uncharacterized protein n=1 Tax=Pelobates cultripes TaxID=61616 RepID=A0AAD1SIY2_PELCU|nr:Hypothetical predicted protein [Pelobates cultripes]